ncbi:MAG: chitinase [Amphiamblys sp. WSBS2006]|nr:MAG: chitinase [Amphiamblys sp. WSBS2006]
MKQTVLLKAISLFSLIASVHSYELCICTLEKAINEHFRLHKDTKRTKDMDEKELMEDHRNFKVVAREYGMRKKEQFMFLANVIHATYGFTEKDDMPDHDGEALSYHGRGMLKLTTEHNYRTIGKNIGRKDILENPDLVAEEPYLAWKTAASFWSLNVRKNGKPPRTFEECAFAINHDEAASGSAGYRLRCKLYQRIVPQKGLCGYEETLSEELYSESE